MSLDSLLTSRVRRKEIEASMADVFTKVKRSAVMSRIRGSGNKETELALIKIFRTHGITGWRRGLPIFGKPDFVFQKKRVVVFVGGCFWHGCPRHSNLPKGNRLFWQKKFSTNKKRDRLVNRILHTAGWQVVRILDMSLPQRGAPDCSPEFRGFNLPTPARQT